MLISQSREVGHLAMFITWRSQVRILPLPPFISRQSNWIKHMATDHSMWVQVLHGRPGALLMDTDKGRRGSCHIHKNPCVLRIVAQARRSHRMSRCRGLVASCIPVVMTQALRMERASIAPIKGQRYRNVTLFCLQIVIRQDGAQRFSDFLNEIKDAPP